MSLYILDTGILVGYIRGAGYAEYIEEKYSVSQAPNIALISVVTAGELLSLAFQLGWGEQKNELVKKLLDEFPHIGIGDQRIIERYAEIDAFSQGKYTSKSLLNGMSSRNMGKNDIWIAATGSVLRATLLTTDRDFDHLDNSFLKVIYIDQELTKSDANTAGNAL